MDEWQLDEEALFGYCYIWLNKPSWPKTGRVAAGAFYIKLKYPSKMSIVEKK